MLKRSIRMLLVLALLMTSGTVLRAVPKAQASSTAQSADQTQSDSTTKKKKKKKTTDDATSDDASQANSDTTTKKKKIEEGRRLCRYRAGRHF